MFAGGGDSSVTLVDTSIWVDHLRHRDKHLAALLEAGQVLCHPFVVGELACGNIRNRAEILDLLKALPRVAVADHGEVMHFLTENRLHSRGLGWIDLHLLASTSLSKATLWTADRALMKAAEELGFLS